MVNSHQLRLLKALVSVKCGYATRENAESMMFGLPYPWEWGHCPLTAWQRAIYYRAVKNLKAKGLIEFIGKTKTGWVEITEEGRRAADGAFM